jgi:hypothetical protein
MVRGKQGLAWWEKHCEVSNFLESFTDLEIAVSQIKYIHVYDFDNTCEISTVSV